MAVVVVPLLTTKVSGRVSEVRADIPLNMLRIFVTFAVLNDVGRVSEVSACML